MTERLSMLKGPDTPALVSQTMADVLATATARTPDADAVVSVWQGTRLSFAALDALAERAAQALHAHGLRPGDRIGLWSANRWEWLVVQFAVAKLGAILVNINPAYRTVELDYVVHHARCKALFMARAFRDFSFVAAAQQVRAAHAALEHLVVFDDATGEPAADGLIGWDAFLAKAGGRRAEWPAPSAEAPANLQYTSGTTGAPKGATLSHVNLVNNARLIGLRLGLGASDRVCLPVPLFHCFGMAIGVLSAFAVGAAVVFPAESFAPDTCLAAVEAERCTALYAVPTMFIAMLHHADFDSAKLVSLRTGLMGGAPCPAEILKAAVERMHMRGVSVVYGMTETSPISFQSLPMDTFEQRVGTVGAVHAHVEAKVIDPATGDTLPLGQPGELCVRGYLVMLGYWDNPEATARAIDADGWMHTGDLARVRPDAHVEIVGRIKDMVIRGGENIYPREVEEILYTLDGVEDAQVFGIPDALYGEQLCAWIRTRPGHALDAEAIRASCKGRIASFKVPALIRFVDSFPTTASGKPQKYRMREIEMAAMPASASTANAPATANA